MVEKSEEMYPNPVRDDIMVEKSERTHPNPVRDDIMVVEIINHIHPH